MSITLDSGKPLFGYKVLIQFLILNLFFFFFCLLRLGLAMWLLLTRYYFSSPALFQLLRANYYMCVPNILGYHSPESLVESSRTQLKSS